MWIGANTSDNYKALDEEQVSDSKTFWENVKPFFSDKGINSSKITLVEKNGIVVDEEKIANIMNNYFVKKNWRT